MPPNREDSLDARFEELMRSQTSTTAVPDEAPGGNGQGSLLPMVETDPVIGEATPVVNQDLDRAFQERMRRQVVVDRFQDMSISEVAVNAMSNIIPNTGQTLLDFARLFQPLDRISPNATTFPQMRELAGLLNEIRRSAGLSATAFSGTTPGLAGVGGDPRPLTLEERRLPPLPGQRRGPERLPPVLPTDSAGRLLTGEGLNTPRLDAVIQFYRENLGLDDELGMAGIKRYIAEQPAEFLGDATAILGLGLASGARVAGAAGRMSQASQLLPKLGITDFLMQAERATRGLARGVDWFDPAALPIRAIPAGVDIGLGMASDLIRGPKSAQDLRVMQLADELGVDLLSSAKTKAEQVPLLEALAVKLGDENLRAKAEKAEADLKAILQRAVDDLGGATDIREIGGRFRADMIAYRKGFEELTGALYKRFEAEGGLDLPASTDNTFAVLSQIAERKAKTVDELKSDTVFEGILSKLEGVRGEERLTGQRITTKPVEGPLGEMRDVTVGGRGDRVVFGQNPNDRYRVRYKLAELDSLIPSQVQDRFGGLADNPDFPQELQPRDRTRTGSQVQIENMARDMAGPFMTSDVPVLNAGAPIIGPDNFVESGNGRVLALRRARSAYPNSYDNYRAALRENLASFGINPAALSGMRDPVLVRERLSEVDRVKFVNEAEGGLTQSPLEVASNDVVAGAVDRLGELEVAENETLFDAITKPKNAEVISHFMQRVPANQRGNLADESGALNRAGLERIKNALLSATYSNGMLGTLIESTNLEGFKNIERALLASLPEISKSELLVRSGHRAEDLSIGADVSQAVRKSRELAAEGTSVDDFLRQQTLISDDLSDEARQLLPVIEEYKRSPSKLAAFLKRYAVEVANQPNPFQPSLIPETPLPKNLIIAKLIGESFDEAPNISDLLDEFVGGRDRVDVPGAADVVGAADVAGAADVVGSRGVIEPWTYDHLKQNRTAIGDKLESNDPVVQGNKRLYRSIYAALSEDMNNTVANHAPHLAPMISEASNTYRAGVELLNSRISKSIWAHKDSPSQIPAMILQSGTSVEDVGRIKGIVSPDAWRQMQAFTLQAMLNRSLNRNKNWNPSGLMTQLDNMGRPKLEAMFGEDVAEELHKIAEVSLSFQRFKRITEGSQTAFLLRVGSMLTGSQGAIYEMLNADPMQAAIWFMTGIAGPVVVSKLLGSEAGQRFLIGETGVVRGAARGLQQIPAGPVRAAGAGSRVVTRTSEKENTGRVLEHVPLRR